MDEKEKTKLDLIRSVAMADFRNRGGAKKVIDQMAPFIRVGHAMLHPEHAMGASDQWWREITEEMILEMSSYIRRERATRAAQIGEDG